MLNPNLNDTSLWLTVEHFNIWIKKSLIFRHKTAILNSLNIYYFIIFEKLRKSLNMLFSFTIHAKLHKIYFNHCIYLRSLQNQCKKALCVIKLQIMFIKYNVYQTFHWVAMQQTQQQWSTCTNYKMGRKEGMKPIWDVHPYQMTLVSSMDTLMEWKWHKYWTIHTALNTKLNPT